MAVDFVFVACPWCVEGRNADGFYCRNCEGSGRVIRGSVDEACHHEFYHFENLGRCLNSHRCDICHKIITVDSS